MNINRNIIYKTRSETNAVFELKFFEYIDMYKKGVFSTELIQKIDGEVQYVIANLPNINDYDEEEIGNRLNVMMYEEQRLLLELVYYIVGERLSNQSSTVTLEQLDAWSDCIMRHGFYIGYTLKDNDISRLLNTLKDRGEYILQNSHDIELRRNEFIEYCTKELGDDKTDDEIISKINIYNNGGYTDLPESVNVIAKAILTNKHYDLWLQLFDVLKYMPLQGRLINDISTLEECCNILKCLSTTEIQRKKLFAYLMRDKAYELIEKEPDFLERNSNNEHLDEGHKKVALSLLEEWNQKKQEQIRSIFQGYLPDLMPDNEENILWLSLQHRHIKGLQGVYQRRKKDILKSIENVIDWQQFEKIDFFEHNLVDIIYYISHVEIKTKEQCEKYVRCICNKIYEEEKMYIPWDLDEDSFAEIRAVYSLLKKSGLDGCDLAQPYMQHVEGYGASCERALRIFRGDKLWLSILLLGTEIEADIEKYRKITNLLFKCIHSCDCNIMEDYILPMGIAELVAIQIYKEEKDKFESELIESMLDLSFVIAVLYLNAGVFFEENSESLRKRYEQEWGFVKQFNKYNKNIPLCEDYINCFVLKIEQIEKTNNKNN